MPTWQAFATGRSGGSNPLAPPSKTERACVPPHHDGRAALQANGVAVLDSLGLLSAVETVGARIDRMDIRSVTGRRLLTAEMPDLGDGLDHAIAVGRTDLHWLLLEAVGGVASVEKRFGCVAVSADPSGRAITSIAPTAGQFRRPVSACRD